MQLTEMNFYRQYPMMRPYVGKHFHSPNIPSLLLIGESHYLLKTSTQHLSAETWYASSSDSLSEDEREWIHTGDVMKLALANNFALPSHRCILRNPLWEINEYGPRYPDCRRVADDVAFYNFFLRPALEGDSLDVCDLDVRFANDAFRLHYEALKPTHIVFLSRHAQDYFHPSELPSVPVITTPHPCSQWWNRVAQEYGNKRGRDILAEFVRTTNWPQSSPSVQ
jgi:hypothetical protein